MSLHDYTVTDASGNDVDLSQYKDNVVLCVNTASECGWTDHYGDLQELYQNYKDKNVVVIAFPCNQFGEQEPGTDQEILEFCQSRYDVNFPVMSKNDVVGENAQPVFKYLTEATGVGDNIIGWNFNKFLVDKEGNFYKWYNQKISFEDIEADIISLL